MHGLSDNADNYLALFNNPELTPLETTTKVVLLTAPERKFPNEEVKTTWFDPSKDEMFKVVEILFNYI
jgi:phospholipase/carboxylesterase